MIVSSPGGWRELAGTRGNRRGFGGARWAGRPSSRTSLHFGVPSPDSTYTLRAFPPYCREIRSHFAAGSFLLAELVKRRGITTYCEIDQRW